VVSDRGQDKPTGRGGPSERNNKNREEMDDEERGESGAQERKVESYRFT
jgi:hypothetical protein